jgi:nicotinamide-nucleotide amidase
MFNTLLKEADAVGKLFLAKNLSIVSAESCTGGQIAWLLTSIAGSSNWFERGFVTYSNEAKHENLGVPMELINTHGAVSEETALAMAEGALAHSKADVSIITTGVAGPAGGTVEKPVGTVWIAVCQRGAKAAAQKFLFSGDRLSIRDQTCMQALIGLKQILIALP